MLFERDFEILKTHSGTHSKFNEIFIKTGQCDRKMASFLKELFEARQTGDYDFSAEITEEAARESLEMARQFLAEARAFFAAQKA